MRGINRAIPNASYSLELISNRKGGCIFLSHTSVDKPDVREIREIIVKIGHYVMDKGIDVYLDEYDEMLQKAVFENNPSEITKLIEHGINNSTHLMCIVSENTQKSWWVPYEVGYAKKSLSLEKLATLKLKKGIYLPDYLSITRELKGAEDLYSFLESIKNDYGLFLESSNYAMESYNENAHPLKEYLEWNT